MRDQIRGKLSAPRELEKLYRSNKGLFQTEFAAIYGEIKGDPSADFWHERLNYESDDMSWGSKNELLFVIIGALVAGLIAKFPVLFNLDEETFYSRNIGFIVFPVLAAYFIWKNKLSAVKSAVIAAAFAAAILFINLLPADRSSDTLVLSCMHMILFLWSLLGFAYIGSRNNLTGRRLGYLKYNGDLVVMTTLILIAGGILSAITIGLFSLIGIPIERFYFDYVIVFALPAAPIIGTYLTQVNPQLVGKVSPVIAKLFSPLVLIMLTIYLVAMGYSGKDPYTDREFLIIFNIMLVGVMAIIFFSVAESAKDRSNRLMTWILFLLSIVTVVVNCIALSAIVFRIAAWGFTPNRLAVMGANVLILVNLIMVTSQLYKVIANRSDVSGVWKSITDYLPVYFIWTIIVTFVFPLIFGFK